MHATKRLLFPAAVAGALVVLLHSHGSRPPISSVSERAAPGNRLVQPAAPLVLQQRIPPPALAGEASMADLHEKGHHGSLGAALAAARHKVEKIDPTGPHSRGADYFATNSGQQLRAWFSKDGIELASGIPTPEGEKPWRVRLRFQGIGRGDQITEAPPGVVFGEDNRIEIQHPGVKVTQWFENGGDGLKQGFTLLTSPGGKPGEVVIHLSLEGALNARAGNGTETICLVNQKGGEVLHYTGLKAWDAEGHPLSARMELGDSDTLALVVSDAGALYPLTIDPMFANMEARLLTEPVEGERFGSSVAVSGDVAVVGAPSDDTEAGVDAGSAYLFTREGEFWNLRTKLRNPDGVASDLFGTSVALFDDTIIVGAPFDRFSSESGTGKAHIFTGAGGDWSRQAVLTAADASPDDEFGFSVAIEGDTALVGARRDTTPAGPGAGSAYVFTRTAGSWSQQAQLTASDAQTGVEFGCSVALSGETAIVGAWYAPAPQAALGGSAYIFVRSRGTWSEEKKLNASDAGVDDEFGISVAIDGDIALVGAWLDDTTAGTDAGSAYVFTRSGSTWSEQDKLTPIDAESFAEFGCSVALDGTSALIGARSDNSDAGFNAGSAYLFSRSGTDWPLQLKMTAGSGAAGIRFGHSVALADGTALVGAPFDARPGVDNAGSVNVFASAGGNWSWQVELNTGDAPDHDHFGAAVAIAGDTALIGAPANDTVAGVDAGGAYVFSRTGSTWALEASLIPGDSMWNDQFGYAVALEGDTALVGARRHDTTAGNDAGTAYVFTRAGGGWPLQAKLTAADAAGGDWFGAAVALSGNTALVGADSADTPTLTDAGSAYVFTRSGDSWLQQAKLTASDAADSDYFGNAVAIDGDTVLVGAEADDTPGGVNTGSAYVFVRTGGSWSQQAKLTAGDAAMDDHLGRASVALDGDTALVGAAGDDTAAGMSAGSAYVFVRNGSLWSQEAKLTAGDAEAGDNFGTSVALDGEVVLVGAQGKDTPSGANVGNVYVFARSGENWSQQARSSPGIDASEDDRFGYSVSLSGDTALVGAIWDYTAGTKAGSVYVIRIGQLPEITRQPLSRTVTPGQAVSFNVTATGYDPLTYQWRKDGYLINGANSAGYAIPSAQLADQGVYDCVVSNLGGVVTSAAATLTVNDLCDFTWGAPGAPPPASGFLLVAIDPPLGLAGWRFVGEKQWRPPGVLASDLTFGTREIEFRPVPGYQHPPREPVILDNGTPLVSLARTYYQAPVPGTGGLSVTLKPDSVAGLAGWRFLGDDGTPWWTSGHTASGLAPGSYLVECKPVGNLVTPPPASVIVRDGETLAILLTYTEADAQNGAPPALVSFDTVTADDELPYAYVGQVRSDVGLSSGFIVRPRVVATAGHVVFNDEFDPGDDSPIYATGLQWLFQRDRANYEPVALVPRGFYLFDGYTAARQELGVVPGEGTPTSQHHDVAALYFLQDAGRGGFSGYLASDATDNEFLLSDAEKILAGYPVDQVDALLQGRMHATPPMNIAFTRVPGEVLPGVPFRTYTTDQIRSTGGCSGGPLCVRFEEGRYYPAAIYLGGSGQTVVRAIDSDVIDLFERAEVSANGGENQVGGGITHTDAVTFGAPTDPGILQVIIEPEAARAAGAGWRLVPETTYRSSGSQRAGLAPGTYVLEFPTVSGFTPPGPETVVVIGGQSSTHIYTYATTDPGLDAWRLAHFGTTDNSGNAADDADPDRDGCPNIDEFTAGTGPNDPTDCLRALAPTLAGSSFSVTVEAKADRVYELQFSPGLDNPFWTTRTTIGPLPADTRATLTDYGAPPTHGFYRIRVSRP